MATRSLVATIVLAAVGYHAASLGAHAAPAAVKTLAVLSSAAGVDDNAGGRDGPLATNGTGGLYGTTEFGGAYGYGTAYELVPPPASAPAGTAWTRVILWNFNAAGAAQEAFPVGGLTAGPSGVMYGVAAGLGQVGLTTSQAQRGAVYRLTPPAARGGAWTLTTLSAFGVLSPNGGLAIDASGALYGTYDSPATISTGTLATPSPVTGGVFRLASAKPGGAGPWTMTTLAQFSDPVQGIYPQGAPAVAADGSITGAAVAGGDPSCHQGWGCGTVFRVRPGPAGTWTLALLHAFHGGADGDQPSGHLLVDSSGGALGTTVQGGDSAAACPLGCGTVFHLLPGGANQIVHAFCAAPSDAGLGCPDGMAPVGGMIRGPAASYYGTASLAAPGPTGGQVFSIDPFGAFTTVATIQSVAGSQGLPALAQISLTSLVGTTSGNDGAMGAAFALAP